MKITPRTTPNEIAMIWSLCTPGGTIPARRRVVIKQIKIQKFYGLLSKKCKAKSPLPKALGIDEGIEVGLVGLEVGCPVGSPLGLAVGLAEGSEVGWLEVGYEVGGLVSPGRVGRDV